MMGYLYFPREENLKKLGSEHMHAIMSGMSLVLDKTPYGFDSQLFSYEFYSDQGMTVETGIMGYTTFFSNRILLSPIIAEQLTWTNNNGVPNNETAMNTVIHELTHRRQMRWLKGFAWLFLNIPGIDMTIERMARENGEAAEIILEKHYDELRKALMCK